MRGPSIFYLFVLLVIFSCGSGNKPGIDESISLVHKSAKGERYSITVEWDETISSTDSTGSTQQRSIKMENVMDYQVEDVDARGVATISGKYTSMKVNGFNSQDSSTYGKDTIMARRFRAMAQKTLRFEVDSLGNVLKVMGG